MSHISLHGYNVVDFKTCHIEHYSSNNCVVLKVGKHDVLALLQGENIGVTTDTAIDTVKERAEPIFKMVIDAHNDAFIKGEKTGAMMAKLKIQDALGIK